MSFDYQPPGWWGPALFAAAVVLLGLAILLMGLLIYGAWHLFGPLLVLTAQQAPAHLADVVGPFR